MDARPHKRGSILLARLLACTAILAGHLACQQANPRISYGRIDDDGQFQQASARPPTAKTLYALAKILAAQQKDQEAAFVLARLIREHPRFMPAYCELAEIQVRARQVGAAAETLSAGLLVSPRETVLLNDLGMCMLLKKDYDKALDYFSQAAQIAPDSSRYRSNMAAALAMIGRYDEALSLFMQVLPEAQAHYNLSVLCKAREDHRRAESEYGRALALGYAPRLPVSD